MTKRKIVLFSKSGYSSAQDALLESFLANPPAIFCAVGIDCQKWEDAMDFLCETRGGDYLSVVTTSHPDESVEEVISFANNWPGNGEVISVTA